MVVLELTNFCGRCFVTRLQYFCQICFGKPPFHVFLETFECARMPVLHGASVCALVIALLNGGHKSYRYRLTITC